MNRRAFLNTLIGGVTATAAVRTWPFRVFSFPAQVKPVPLDLGFNVFDYVGIPIIEDKDCPPGYIFSLDDRYIAGPNSIKQILNIKRPLLKPMAHCRIEGLQV